MSVAAHKQLRYMNQRIPLNNVVLGHSWCLLSGQGYSFYPFSKIVTWFGGWRNGSHEVYCNMKPWRMNMELDAVLTITGWNLLSSQWLSNHLANSHIFPHLLYSPSKKKFCDMVLLIFMCPEVGQACIILSGLWIYFTLVANLWKNNITSYFHWS